MRSPDWGTHRAFPLRFFCDCSNYIAQIVSKYPNLFPEYLHSIESSVNSENAAARGQTRHVPLHSTITLFLVSCVCFLQCTHYKKVRKIRHHDDEVRRSKYLYWYWPKLVPASVCRPQSACATIVHCFEVTGQKTCEYCCVIVPSFFSGFMNFDDMLHELTIWASATLPRRTLTFQPIKEDGPSSNWKIRKLKNKVSS